jgi:hypothetical protein
MRNRKAQGPAYETIAIILAIVMGIALVGGILVFWDTIQGGFPGGVSKALQDAPPVCVQKAHGPVWYTIAYGENDGKSLTLEPAPI